MINHTRKTIYSEKAAGLKPSGIRKFFAGLFGL